MGKNNPQTLNQKRWFYVILPLFIGSVIAYLDRVNIAYAALTMNQELGFSASIYSMGAGIFCRLRPLRNSGRGRHDQLLRKYRGLCEIVFRRMDQSVDRFLSSAFAGNPAFMRGGMLFSSASADVALDAGADEPAEALCEGGSYIGNHGFTRGAPLGLSVFYDVFDFGLFFHVDPKGTKNGTILTKKQETVKGILA